MNDLNKDIEILKEMLENKEDIIKYHSWIGTKSIDAIENVLKALEGKDCVIETQAHNEEVYEELVKKLETELETYKKIAEKLAVYVDLSYTDINCSPMCIHDNCREECIIDWARNEVENEKNNSNT